MSMDDIGGASVYLLSNLSGSNSKLITWTGYNIVGMKAVDAPDISVV